MSVKRSMLVAVLALLIVVPSVASAAPPPTIGVGSNPIAMAISAKRAEMLVANDGSVSFVDLKTNTQTAEVGTGVNHGQTAIGLVQNGAKAYIGQNAKNKMLIMNTDTQTVTGQVAVGFGASDIAATNGFAYITLVQPQKIAIVNAANNKLVKQIQLGQDPQNATVAPGGRYVWVGSAVTGLIWVVDNKTKTVVRRLRPTRGGPVSGIAFSPNGKRVWVSGLGGVSVLDRGTGKLLAFVGALGVFPNSSGPNVGPIVLNKAGTKAMVLDSTFPDTPGIGTVSVLNTATLKPIQQISLGVEPLDLVNYGPTGTTYANNYADDTLSYFPTP
jgi:DNA-binding beta-propeller fold protein YncE